MVQAVDMVTPQRETASCPVLHSLARGESADAAKAWPVVRAVHALGWPIFRHYFVFHTHLSEASTWYEDCPTEASLENHLFWTLPK